MLEVVKRLKDGRITVRELEDDYGIIVRHYPDIIILNYTSYSSPKFNIIADGCRGLILNRNTYDIVCLPFERFYNYGENPKIDCNKVFTSKEYNVRVQEKVDGSIMKVYHFDGQWHIATNGTAYGEAQINIFGGTFRSTFLKALGVTEEGFQEAMAGRDKEVCHIFELTSPDNKVIVDYGRTPLAHYLISRRRDNGLYVNHNFSDLDHLEIKSYQFNSLEECVKKADSFGEFQEGFVVYLDNVPRFKVKSARYVELHYLRGEGLTPKRIIELIITGEYVEYINYFPADKDNIYFYKDLYEKWLDHKDKNFLEYMSYPNGKVLYDHVKDFPDSDLYLKAYNRNVKPSDIYCSGDVHARAKRFKNYLINTGLYESI